MKINIRGTLKRILRNGKRCIRGLMFITLVTVVGFFSLTAIANIIDWKTDFLEINPPLESYVKHLPLEYPDTYPRGLALTYDGSTAFGMPLFNFMIILQHNGTLVEGNPMFMAAVGYIYPEGQENISGVDVGFIGSSYYEGGGSAISNAPPVVRVDLENAETYTTQIIHGTYGGRNICWDVQGDYSPFINILFKNGSDIVTITYEDYEIHVSPLEVAKQERYSRINTALSVALFFFALIESLTILTRLVPNKWKTWLGFESNTNTNNNAPKNEQINTETSKGKKQRIRRKGHKGRKK